MMTTFAENKIPYIEVIGKYDRTPFAIVEPSQCWFELSFYEIGEFEIYCIATQNNLNSLQMGNYVKIPHKPYCWIIKSIQYTYNVNGAKMIVARGFEAKWLLKTRIIQSPFTLPSSLANALFKLVDGNMGASAVSARKIVGWQTTQPTFNIALQDTQATRADLNEFVLNLLKTNHCGSKSEYDATNKNIVWSAFEGRDLTNAIVFAQSMDNLLSSDYQANSEDVKTMCQVVSTFTEKDDQDENISIDYVQTYDKGQTGIDRNEMTIQSNLSTKYTDDQGVEQETTPTSNLYKGWQQEEGKNKLAEHILKREFSGVIDMEHSQFAFEEDFFIGDLVKVRDEHFGIEANARILKYTFKIESTYGEVCDYQME